MRKAMKAIRTMWYWLTRYMVAIDWEGMRIVHWGTSYEDAVEWMRLYPAEAVVMIGKRGRLMSARY
jgi:hypothetical protein